MSVSVLHSGPSRKFLAASVNETIPPVLEINPQSDAHVVYGKTLEGRELFFQSPLRYIGPKDPSLSLYTGRKSSSVHVGAEINESLNLEGLSSQAVVSLEQQTRTGSCVLAGVLSSRGSETEQLVDRAGEALTNRLGQDFLRKVTVTADDVRAAFHEVDCDYSGQRSVLLNHLDTTDTELRGAFVCKHGGHLWFMRLGEYYLIIGSLDEWDGIQYKVLGNPPTASSTAVQMIGNEPAKRNVHPGSSNPDVLYHPIQPNDRYAILISKGIHRCYPPYELVATTHRMNASSNPPGFIARRFVEDALKRQTLLRTEFAECQAIVMFLGLSGTGGNNTPPEAEPLIPIAHLDHIVVTGLEQDTPTRPRSSGLNLTPSSAAPLQTSGTAKSKRVLFNVAQDNMPLSPVAESPATGTGAVYNDAPMDMYAMGAGPLQVDLRDRDSASSLRGLAPGLVHAPPQRSTSSHQLIQSAGHGDEQKQGFLKNLLGFLKPKKKERQEQAQATAPATASNKADQLARSRSASKRLLAIDQQSTAAQMSVTSGASSSTTRRSLDSHPTTARSRSQGSLLRSEHSRKGASLDLGQRPVPAGAGSGRNSSGTVNAAPAGPPPAPSTQRGRGPSQGYNPRNSGVYTIDEAGPRTSRGASAAMGLSRDRQSSGYANVASISTRQMLDAAPLQTQRLVPGASQSQRVDERASRSSLEKSTSAVGRQVPVPPGFARDIPIQITSPTYSYTKAPSVRRANEVPGQQLPYYTATVTPGPRTSQGVDQPGNKGGRHQQRK